MKKLNRHKILSAACIAALPLLVVACLEFDGIIQPGRALTDSEIEVTAQLRVSPGEDGSGKVVFAVFRRPDCRQSDQRWQLQYRSWWLPEY